LCRAANHSGVKPKVSRRYRPIGVGKRLPLNY
jgi:hypothetical protein